MSQLGTLWQPIEFTEYHSPDGQVLKFDDLYRFLVSDTGYGMPGINYISQQGPYQHGNTIYDYRLQPRVIQLLFRENACSREEYWNKRANVLNILRPNRQVSGEFNLGTLRKILPDTSKRDINVLVEEGPAFAARDPSKWDEWSYQETLRFIAPDPTFYDPDMITTAPWQPSSSDQLVLPVTFDDSSIVFTAVGGFGAIEVNYVGTWLTYPTIYISGPFQDPIITNYATGEKIDMTGYHVALGDTVTINLQFGYKTITNIAGTNLIGYVSTDSDLATFHIAPDPESPSGYNNIVFEGSGFVVGETLLRLSYYTRYIAI